MQFHETKREHKIGADVYMSTLGIWKNNIREIMARDEARQEQWARS